MRKIMVLAATLAALGIASQLAEAGDRGVWLPPFLTARRRKIQRPHHDLKFHHRGFFESTATLVNAVAKKTIKDPL